MVGPPNSPRWLEFRRVVIASSLAVTVAGCGNGDAAKQLDRAKQAVETALDAWQRADAAPALSVSSVPIEFFDDEREKAATLVNYEILQTYMETDGTPRCAVQLVVRRADQSSEEQFKVTYQIVTKDNKIIIGRDPFS